MPGQPRFKKLYRCVFLVLVVGVCRALPLSAQTLPEYTKKFEEAVSADEFETTFVEMMTQFRSGKISFKDDDVMVIVNIARGKPYAENVLANVYAWAGTMFGNGRMDAAIDYFMESANLYRMQKKRVGEALSYFEIALVQHKAENYEEAKEYYDKILAINNDSLSHRIIINCFNGLALIQREQGKFNEAQKDFLKAYQVAIHNKDTAWIAILAGNIGSIHLRNHRLDSSLYYYFRNLKLIKRVTEVENEIEAYAHIGRVFIGMKDYRKARIYLDSSVSIIKNRKIFFSDFFNPMDYINESYAQLYAALGDYHRAYDYQNKFHEVAQEKQRHLNSRNLKQLQAAYAFKQKQSELELLRKVNDANVAKIKLQQYAQMAFVVIIILVSVIAFISWNTARQRKSLNTELSHTNEELARLNQVKDQLFSVISHDLRAPLGNLQSVLDLYREGDLDEEEFDKVLTELSSQIKASGNALENLLHWARAQLSKIKVSPERLVVKDITAKVLQQFKLNLEEKKISDYNQLSSSEIAWADKNQVEIILRNLIGNAIKFTPEGGTIKIVGDVNDNQLHIAVEDSGVGMSDEELENLFKPDRNFSSPGTNQEKGTGIGLLICKEMITNNGGKIWVESAKNKGSQFSFTLPCPQ